MKNDITEKLRTELGKDIRTEAQVVYVLSRIRKILEIEKNREFRILKFYCDWALHAEIENVDAVKEILDGIIAGRDEPSVNFFLFSPLHEELKKFMKENNLPTDISDSNEKRQRINAILFGIYTDTPSIVKHNEKVRLTWKGTTSEMTYGGSFNVEKLETKK